MEVAPSFFLFFLIYLSFCSSWPPLWARQRSCRVSHHHAQCHIIIHSVTSYTVGKAEMDWKSHPCFFFNFFFLLAKRQRCNGTLLDLNRLRETGLVASFFFLTYFDGMEVLLIFFFFSWPPQWESQPWTWLPQP